MRFHKLVDEDAYLCQLLTWMNKKDAYEKSFVGRILRKKFKNRIFWLDIENRRA